MRFIVTILILIFVFTPTLSTIYYRPQADTRDYPIINQDFVVLNSVYEVVDNLDVSKYSVSENSTSRTVVELSYTANATPSAVSNLILLDLSASQTGGYSDMSNLQISRVAIEYLARISNANAGECAMMTYNQIPILQQDYTNSPDDIINKLSALTPRGGSFMTEAFTDPTNGAIKQTEVASHSRKVINVILDGPPSLPFTANDIEKLANTKNIQINIMGINTALSLELKQLVWNTGGMFYERISTQKEAINAAAFMALSKTDISPATISWQTENACAGCTGREVEIITDQSGQYINTFYSVPKKGIKYLEAEVSTAYLSNVSPGNVRDALVQVTAVNGDFNITDVSSSNNKFSVSPKIFSLSAGQSQTMRITYSAADRLYQMAKFEFANDGCEFNMYAKAGFPGQPVANKTLEIVSPKANDTLLAGDNFLIEWDGVTPDDMVLLEYSTDSGMKWNVINSAVSGNQYLWGPIPQFNSNACMLRISHEDMALFNKSEMLRHSENEMATVRWFHNGTKFISSGGNELVIWDNTTRQKLNISTLNCGRINNVEISPDDNYIALACANNKVLIINANTMAITQEINGHYNEVNSVTWSPDNKYLASASSDGIMTIWNRADWSLATVLNGYSGEVNTIDWSPDGKYLASGHSNNEIIIWDVASWWEFTRLSEHVNPINSVKWSPNGNRLASASNAGVVRIWEVDRWNCTLILLGHSGPVNEVRWNPNGQQIATSGFLRLTCIWNLSDCSREKEIYGTATSFHTSAWSPDGRSFATGQNDGYIYIYYDMYDFIQTASSNKYWNIYSPNISARDIDMGTVILGTSAEKVVNDYFENKPQQPQCRIDAVYISGPQADEFSVVCGGQPIIAPGAFGAIEFRCTPTSLGPKEADIVIQSQAGTLVYKITANIVEPVISQLADRIDMGSVLLPGQKDSLGIELIENQGTINTIIVNMLISGTDKDDFKINSGFDQLFEAGSKLLADLSFTPKTEGQKNAELSIHIDGLPGPIVIPLQGEAQALKVQKLADEHDIADIYIGDFIETDEIYLFENISDNVVVVKSVKLTCPDNSITLFGNPVNATLAAGQQFANRFRFAPLTVGQHEAKLTVEFENIMQTFEINIVAEAFRPEISIITPNIDFGDVIVNTGGLMTGGQMFRNEGPLPLKINSATILDDPAQVFLINSDKGYYELPVGGYYTADISYRPDLLVNNSARFVVDFLADLADYNCPLSGTGVLPTASATIRISSAEAETGQSLGIDIIMEDSGLIEEAMVSGFECRLKYNSTVLSAQDFPDADISDDSGIISLTLPAKPQNGNVLETLNFTTALGNSEYSDIEIISIEPQNGSCTFTLEPGRVNLTDICTDGGKRLINPNSIVALKSVSPNPADDFICIDYELSETGGAKVTISDLTGRVAKELELSHELGSANIEIDSSDMPSGVYCLTMTTATWSGSRMIIVRK